MPFPLTLGKTPVLVSSNVLIIVGNHYEAIRLAVRRAGYDPTRADIRIIVDDDNKWQGYDRATTKQVQYFAGGTGRGPSEETMKQIEQRFGAPIWGLVAALTWLDIG